jgi:hypothetical protein
MKETKSCGSKLKESCSISYFGFVLYLASIVVLNWTEGGIVKRVKDIDEGRDIESIYQYLHTNNIRKSIDLCYWNCEYSSPSGYTQLRFLYPRKETCKECIMDGMIDAFWVYIKNFLA